MRIFNCTDEKALALKGASIVKLELSKKPALLLCAATGGSPLPLYKELVLESQKKTMLFDQLRVIPLDEWIGLDHPSSSCDAYLHQHLLDPLHIKKKNYFPFNTEAKDIQQECERIRQQLNQEGPIDLCILGLGANGHLGLNEPAGVLQPHCHIAQLAPESRNHRMLKSATIKPTKGLTLGMQDILASKRILMIISGSGKAQTTRAFFKKKIDSQLPASYL